MVTYLEYLICKLLDYNSKIIEKWNVLISLIFRYVCWKNSGVLGKIVHAIHFQLLFADISHHNLGPFFRRNLFCTFIFANFFITTII